MNLLALGWLWKTIATTTLMGLVTGTSPFGLAHSPGPLLGIEFPAWPKLGTAGQLDISCPLPPNPTTALAGALEHAHQN